MFFLGDLLLNSLFYLFLSSYHCCLQFRKYSIKLGTDGEEMAMALWDTMGLCEDNDTGMVTPDIKSVLMGKFKDRQAVSDLCVD